MRDGKERVNYKEWEETVPTEIKADSVRKVEAYGLALFAGDLSWHDLSKLIRDKRMINSANQLYRAAGAGSAEEGFSRGPGKDRARFGDDALGSARESRDWYFKD